MRIGRHVLRNCKDPESGRIALSLFIARAFAVARNGEGFARLRDGQSERIVSSRRGLLRTRGRFRAVFTLSLVQQKAASLSTFRVLAHFAVRVCLRVVLESKTEEYTTKRRGEKREQGAGQGREARPPAGGGRGEGWRDLSTFWWLETGRRRARRDGPGSYGIIYLTGRETKRTKHCRGVAPQTEPLAEVR